MSENFKAPEKIEVQKARIAIAISRFNEEITEALLKGAKEAYARFCPHPEPLDCFWVPGAFELPYLAKKLAKTKKYDAVLCLGAIIKGGTPHFEYVSQAAANGISQVSIDVEIPVLFGVLTCENNAQAQERVRGENNKGYQTMLAALEMVALSSELV